MVLQFSQGQAYEKIILQQQRNKTNHVYHPSRIQLSGQEQTMKIYTVIKMNIETIIKKTHAFEIIKLLKRNE